MRGGQCLPAGQRPGLREPKTRHADGSRASGLPLGPNRGQMLAYRAAEERNKAAGQALELSISLPRPRPSAIWSARARLKTAAMLTEVDHLQQQGIRVEKGFADLRRQWPELLDRQSQIHVGLEQANSHLRQLLGLCPDDPVRIWPAADWKVTPEVPDEQAAICLGMQHRADLGLLCMLAQSVDDNTLEASGAGFAAYLGIPAAPVVLHVLHLHSGDRCEAAQRREQFNNLLTGRRQAAAEEIRLDVRVLAIRLEQIAIAQMKVDRCREEVDALRLRRQRPQTTVTGLDIGAAELQCLDKQSDLIRQVVAWRIAQVQLDEPKGSWPSSAARDAGSERRTGLPAKFAYLGCLTSQNARGGCCDDIDHSGGHSSTGGAHGAQRAGRVCLPVVRCGQAAPLAGGQACRPQPRRDGRRPPESQYSHLSHHA